MSVTPAIGARTVAGRIHKSRTLYSGGIKAAVAEVTELPTVTVPLTGEPAIGAVNKLIEALEDHDDVKEVYSNAAFPDEAVK